MVKHIEEDAKVLFKRSFTSYTKTCSTSINASKTRMVQMKRKQSMKGFYAEGGKIKRDLSLETDFCVLKRRFKQKLLKLSNTDRSRKSAKSRYSNFTERDPIDEFERDDSASGDNHHISLHTIPRPFLANTEDVMYNNLNKLMRNWFQEILTDTKLKNIVEKVFECVEHKTQTQKIEKSSSFSTYVVEKDKYGKRSASPSNMCHNMNSRCINFAAEQSSYIRLSNDSIPILYKTVRLLSTLTIPRRIGKRQLKTKKRKDIKIKMKKRPNRKLLVTLIQPSSMTDRSNTNIGLFDISTQSWLRKCTTVDEKQLLRELEKNNSYVIFKSVQNIKGLSYNKCKDFNKADCYNDNYIQAASSLVDSIYEDPCKTFDDNKDIIKRTCNITQATAINNKNFNEQNHKTKYGDCKTSIKTSKVLVGIDKNKSIVAVDFTSHNQNHSHKVAYVAKTKFKSVQTATNTLENTEKDNNIKKTKDNIKIPNVAVLEDIVHKQFTYSKISKEGEHNQFLDHLQDVLNYFASYKTDKDMRLDIHVNVYPTFDEIVSPENFPSTVVYNAGLVFKNEKFNVYDKQNIIPILDGAASEAKYLLNNENTQVLDKEKDDDDSNKTKQRTLVANDLRLKEELNEIKSTLRSVSKLVHHYFTKKLEDKETMKELQSKLKHRSKNAVSKHPVAKSVSRNSDTPNKCYDETISEPSTKESKSKCASDKESVSKSSLPDHEDAISLYACPVCKSPVLNNQCHDHKNLIPTKFTKSKGSSPKSSSPDYLDSMSISHRNSFNYKPSSPDYTSSVSISTCHNCISPVSNSPSSYKYTNLCRPGPVYTNTNLKNLTLERTQVYKSYHTKKLHQKDVISKIVCPVCKSTIPVSFTDKKHAIFISSTPKHLTLSLDTSSDKTEAITPRKRKITKDATFKQGSPDHNVECITCPICRTNISENSSQKKFSPVIQSSPKYENTSPTSNASSPTYTSKSSPYETHNLKKTTDHKNANYKITNAVGTSHTCNSLIQSSRSSDRNKSVLNYTASEYKGFSSKKSGQAYKGSVSICTSPICIGSDHNRFKSAVSVASPPVYTDPRAKHYHSEYKTMVPTCTLNSKDFSAAFNHKGTVSVATSPICVGSSTLNYKNTTSICSSAINIGMAAKKTGVENSTGSTYCVQPIDKSLRPSRGYKKTTIDACTSPIRSTQFLKLKRAHPEHKSAVAKLITPIYKVETVKWTPEHKNFVSRCQSPINIISDSKCNTEPLRSFSKGSSVKYPSLGHNKKRLSKRLSPIHKSNILKSSHLGCKGTISICTSPGIKFLGGFKTINISGLKLSKEARKPKTRSEDLVDVENQLVDVISYRDIESESLIEVTDMTSKSKCLNGTGDGTDVALTCSLPQKKTLYEIGKHDTNNKDLNVSGVSNGKILKQNYNDTTYEDINGTQGFPLDQRSFNHSTFARNSDNENKDFRNTLAQDFINTGRFNNSLSQDPNSPSIRTKSLQQSFDNNICFQNNATRTVNSSSQLSKSSPDSVNKNRNFLSSLNTNQSIRNSKTITNSNQRDCSTIGSTHTTRSFRNTLVQNSTNTGTGNGNKSRNPTSTLGSTKTERSFRNNLVEGSTDTRSFRNGTTADSSCPEINFRNNIVACSTDDSQLRSSTQADSGNATQNTQNISTTQSNTPAKHLATNSINDGQLMNSTDSGNKTQSVQNTTTTPSSLFNKRSYIINLAPDSTDTDNKNKFKTNQDSSDDNGNIRINNVMPNILSLPSCYLKGPEVYNTITTRSTTHDSSFQGNHNTQTSVETISIQESLIANHNLHNTAPNSYICNLNNNNVAQIAQNLSELKIYDSMNSKIFVAPIPPNNSMHKNSEIDPEPSGLLDWPKNVWNRRIFKQYGLWIALMFTFILILLGACLVYAVQNNILFNDGRTINTTTVRNTVKVINKTNLYAVKLSELGF